MTGPTPRQGRSGFTLLEMLVALGVTSLLAALMLQLLAQGAKMEAQSARWVAWGAPESLKETWLRDALGSAMAQGGEGGAVFVGESARLEFLSPDSISPSGPGYDRLLLQLQPAPDSRVVLMATSMRRPRSGESEGAASPLTLMSWPAAVVRFRYRDSAGTWHDAWPPHSTDSPAPIPVAVALDVDAKLSRSMIVANPNTSVTLPGKRDLGDE